MQEFLNKNLKPYNALTREEKHILLDAALDMRIEYTYNHGNSWYYKEAVCVEFYNDTIYRTKPKEYKKLDIPWHHIHPVYNYFAMDFDGGVYFYEILPDWLPAHKEWSFNGGLVAQAECLLLDTTGIVAEHSLTIRPE